MKITVVTGNAHKAVVVAAFFSGTLEVLHVALDIPEHRSEDVCEIAREKARYAWDHPVSYTHLTLPTIYSV